MTPKEMAEHIDRLTKDNGITVKASTRNGRAWRRQKKIATPPVKSGTTYALALHEIGHILGKRQSGRRLESEIGAWQWAIDNAETWSPAMTKKVSRCLNSYLKSYRRHKTAIITPAAEQEINDLINRLD